MNMLKYFLADDTAGRLE